jgi:hypothetical protein
MTPLKKHSGSSSIPGVWLRIGWLLLAILILAIVGLRLADSQQSYESGPALFALNFVFTTLLSVFISILAARAFIATGHPGLLMLCCAMLVWGGLRSGRGSWQSCGQLQHHHPQPRYLGVGAVSLGRRCIVVAPSILSSTRCVRWCCLANYFTADLADYFVTLGERFLA